MRGRSLTPFVPLIVLASSLASQQPTRTTRTTRTARTAHTARTMVSAATHSIDVGQTEHGAITRRDVVLESDSTYAQEWTIQGRAGQTITIDLESDAFDSFLFLRGPGIRGGRDFQDDDGGGNCHARLTASFPQTGAYQIVVNTAIGEHYVTGPFTLSVTSGSKPRSVTPCRRNSNQ